MTRERVSHRPESRKKIAGSRPPQVQRELTVLELKPKSHKLTNLEVNSDAKFDHITSGHKGPKEVIVADPIFENPNSTKAVRHIARHIGIDNKIARYGGSERQWTFICSDGRPHSLFHSVIDNSVVCSLCYETITSVDIESHWKSEHTGSAAPHTCSK